VAAIKEEEANSAEVEEAADEVHHMAAEVAEEEEAVVVAVLQTSNLGNYRNWTLSRFTSLLVPIFSLNLIICADGAH
jgi:hypothetical protein